MAHRVYMRFEECQGWRVSFRDLDRTGDVPGSDVCQCQARSNC
jgi:hypothetical protein